MQFKWLKFYFFIASRVKITGSFFFVWYITIWVESRYRYFTFSLKDRLTNWKNKNGFFMGWQFRILSPIKSTQVKTYIFQVVTNYWTNGDLSLYRITSNLIQMLILRILHKIVDTMMDYEEFGQFWTSPNFI